MAQVIFKLNYQGVGKVALQSPQVKALIAARLAAGVNSAARATGSSTEDLAPKLSFGNNRWYGTYGAPAQMESETHGLSDSVGGMKNG